MEKRIKLTYEDGSEIVDADEIRLVRDGDDNVAGLLTEPGVLDDLRAGAVGVRRIPCSAIKRGQYVRAKDGKSWKLVIDIELVD